MNPRRAVIPSTPVLLAGLLALALPGHALGQGKSPTDLALVSLEDLMNIQVTSASRKEQRADAVPAPVYVITQDDIRRSGMTTVPELLRLVPGLQVAQINSNKWAISARGFNGLFSNKLLVLVDGRSIYDPLNSGQFLESEDLVLEDIDRIEVVRGPAGAVWGANAANGVINILTKAAGDTAGASVRMSAGTFERVQGSARYGGSIGAASYRVFTQWSEHAESLRDRQTPAGDDWRAMSSGLRIDWKAARNAFLLEANGSSATLDPLWININVLAPPGPPVTASGPSDTQIANVLGRWTYTRDHGGVLQVQSFFDSRPRYESGGQSNQKTTDIDLQYHTRIGSRQDVVVGAGTRLNRESLAGTFVLSVVPSESVRTTANLFVQDEITLLRNRVHVTLGSRLEHDTHTEWGVQPTARVLWDVAQGQRVWAGISRALRTPALFDLGIRLNLGLSPSGEGLPTEISILGNPAMRPEGVVSTEAGYRVNLGTRASIDVAAFASHYDSLQTIEPIQPFVEFVPGPPHLVIASQYGNLLQAVTSGVEIDGRWQPVSGWRLDGSYTGFRFTPHLDVSSRDLAAATADGNAPRHQWQVHSSVSLGARAQFDAAFFHVGALGEAKIAAYSRADARVESRLTRHFSVSLVGQNLFNRAHAEYGGEVLLSTLIPRSARVQLAWRY
jgi:iron complex outermembrane recepter protein